MNKKIIRQIAIILFLLVVLFIVYKLIKTYAVFYSEGNGIVEQKQASWIIKVNNTDITSSTKTTFIINQIEYSSSSHVASNKIAPGLDGCFYIIIDPSATNVAIRYDIKLDKSSLTNNSITISSIEEINNNNILKRTDNSIYTGVISLSDVQSGKKDKIKFNVNWINNEDNNSNDTIIGTTQNPSINIPVTVNVTQYLGENITDIGG